MSAFSALPTSTGVLPEMPGKGMVGGVSRLMLTPRHPDRYNRHEEQAARSQI
jgi:hypothetical protein